MLSFANSDFRGKGAQYLAIEAGRRPLIQLENRAKELWRDDRVGGKECHKVGFGDWRSSGQENCLRNWLGKHCKRYCVYAPLGV